MIEKNKLENLSVLVKRAAKEAGKVHARYFHQDIKIETKGVSFDLVSSVDRDAEERIRELISDDFPDHNILGEENGPDQKGSEFTWIIDPLDGTTNFIFGLPFFCSSVALVYRNRLLAGAVYDVVHDELFWAVSGQGAWLNEHKIIVSSTASLDQSLLITGFFYERGESMIRNLEIMRHFFEYPVRGIRRLGSAALDLCYVASGRATGFWEFQLNPWDFAAAALIVREAGGVVSNEFGKDIPLTETAYIAASNGLIHQDLLHVLQSA